MMNRVAMMAFAAGALAFPSGVEAAREGRTITAEVRDSAGAKLGTIEFRGASHGTVISVDLRGLPPGLHGFHVHERGVCDAPDFKSAGGHYNPGHRAHGFDTSDGYHAGDLANLVVHEDGTARTEQFSPLINTSEASGHTDGPPYTLFSASGSAIVIHQNPDDYKHMASAGGRIACGVIAPPKS